jgi:hypothetical protein
MKRQLDRRDLGASLSAASQRSCDGPVQLDPGGGTEAAWALSVPLDRAVAGSGTVVVAQNRQSIQHLTGG